MKSKNFIPAHRLHARGRRRRLRGWALLCGGYMVVLAGGSLVCRGLWHDGQVGMADQLDKVASRVDESRQEMAALKTTLASAESTLNAKRALHDEPDWSKLLVLLVDGLDDEIVLTKCLLSPPKPPQKTPGAGGQAAAARGDDSVFVLHLAGYGRNQAAVSRFVLGLEQMSLFDQVRRSKTRREPFLADYAIAFELECPLGGPGGPNQ
jgi:Tfp pilus assembly protein PilN